MQRRVSSDGHVRSTEVVVDGANQTHDVQVFVLLGQSVRNLTWSGAWMSHEHVLSAHLTMPQLPRHINAAFKDFASIGWNVFHSAVSAEEEKTKNLAQGKEPSSDIFTSSLPSVSQYFWFSPLCLWITA